MIHAIVKEIRLITVSREAGLSDYEPVETIYFGGGTPSLLDIVEINLIMQALIGSFEFTADPEITLEANPEDVTALKLEQWQTAGFNRLSVGIQSFSDKELVWMNRSHSAEDAKHCLELIRISGIRNFSIDLIYGSPLLTDENWKRHIDLLLEKNVPHLSCYALTVEPKTALFTLTSSGKKDPVNQEAQARQFVLLMEWMKQAGYEHYEISNFAIQGMRSRHNSSYWSGKPYYGFGPSAHSYAGNVRKWNISNNAMYIASLQKDQLPFEAETLSSIEQMNEYTMISLRTHEGLDLSQVGSRFGTYFVEKLKQAALKWKKGGKLIVEDEKIILTTEGKLFADGIAADLFF